MNLGYIYTIMRADYNVPSGVDLRDNAGDPYRVEGIILKLVSRSIILLHQKYHFFVE